ncbi:MAG: HAD family hydrolase [Chloroflexota bacterium]
MSIDTILFDVGGVIIEPLDHDAVWRARDHLAQELGFGSGEEMWLAFYESDVWAAAKTGAILHEEMWETLLRPYGLLQREMQTRFVTRLHEGEGMRPEMAALIRTLHPHYKLGILSNWDDRLESILEERLEIAAYFNVILNSHRIGAAKPDEEAFRLALSRLDARPHQVLFIDDLERNTNAAAALGLHTHTYRDFSALLADLKQREILPEEWTVGDS